MLEVNLEMLKLP